MLAVVQHEQPVARRQRGDHGRLQGGRLLLGNTHRLSHGRDHSGRIRDPYQVDEPCAVAALGGQVGGDADRQAGLADPARADRRYEPMLGEQLGECGALRPPADERRHRDRQGATSTHAFDRRLARQGAPVGRLQLPQQGSDVAVDRSHGDAQRLGDLCVRQMLAHQRQHLCLARQSLRCRPSPHTKCAATRPSGSARR